MSKSTGLVFAEKPSIGIEPTRLYDRSRFGNHGAVSGAVATRLPSGLWGWTFVDGDDDTITIASFLPKIRSNTFLIWAIPNFDHNTAGINGGLITLRTGGGNYISWYFDGTNDYLYTRWRGDTTWPTTTTLMSFHAGDPLFMAVSAEVGSASLKVYCNGVLIDSEAVTLITAMETGNHRIDIGNWFDSSLDFDGVLALPRISRVLTLGQIKKIFEAERHWFGV